MIDSIQNSNYDRAQQYLSNQIKPQAENLTDLKRNANLKLRQVELARKNGDLELAAVLAYEHQQIVQDINNCNKGEN